VTPGFRRTIIARPNTVPCLERRRRPEPAHHGGDWDWSKGEPPMDNPAYYLRFCKTFNRMGGTLDYVCLDNIQFMLALYQALKG
jgi:hypothetical protein